MKNIKTETILFLTNPKNLADIFEQAQQTLAADGKVPIRMVILNIIGKKAKLLVSFI